MKLKRSISNLAASSALHSIRNFIGSFGETIAEIFKQDPTNIPLPVVPAMGQAEEQTPPPTTEESKDEGQPMSSFASMSKKPKQDEKPAAQSKDDDEEDDDNEKDLQAAILTLRQAPTSLPKDSGAQSSTPRGSAGLPDEEDRVIAQITTLMTELVDLESKTKHHAKLQDAINLTSAGQSSE